MASLIVAISLYQNIHASAGEILIGGNFARTLRHIINALTICVCPFVCGVRMGTSAKVASH